MFKKMYPVWLLAFLFVFLAFGCSDDEDPPTQQTTPTMEHTPTLQSVTIPQAMTQSTDPHAQLAVTYINLANSLSGLGSYFNPPTKAAKTTGFSGSATDTLTWTWNAGYITVILKFWETDTHYYWRYIWHGTYDQVVYNNWIWYDANQTKDGTAGQLVWYDDNSTTPLLTWEWTYVSNVYTLTYYFEGVDRLVIVVNADGSGSLNYYDNNILSLKIEWNADGSGEWWTYNPVGNGTWAITKQ